ncbi:MAG TPA: hypothetical protein VNW94_02980 [Streptosporangiaceae bacterium]|jgi:hypothetical protein|nr:hypothetical protein [Streptosporangiaceae bacterium]
MRLLVRGVAGVLCLLVGALWFGQGIGVIHGSFMTGQKLYAVLGALLLIGGALLLARTFLRRRS